MLIKAGKALDKGNARRALLEAENARLRANNEAQKPRTRKRVKKGANNKFASIAAIAKAQEASLQPPKLKKQKKTADPPPNL